MRSMIEKELVARVVARLKPGQVCALCKGTGLNTTGTMINGTPEPVCVRCGGYGTIPNGCDNPNHVIYNEHLQMLREKESLQC